MFQLNTLDWHLNAGLFLITQHKSLWDWSKVPSIKISLHKNMTKFEVEGWVPLLGFDENLPLSTLSMLLLCYCSILKTPTCISVLLALFIMHGWVYGGIFQKTADIKKVKKGGHFQKIPWGKEIRKEGFQKESPVLIVLCKRWRLGNPLEEGDWENGLLYMIKCLMLDTFMLCLWNYFQTLINPLHH